MNDTDPPFLLFGFGPRRRKLVYAGGRLLDAFTLEPALDLGRVRDAEAAASICLSWISFWMRIQLAVRCAAI